MSSILILFWSAAGFIEQKYFQWHKTGKRTVVIISSSNAADLLELIGNNKSKIFRYETYRFRLLTCKAIFTCGIHSILVYFSSKRQISTLSIPLPCTSLSWKAYCSWLLSEAFILIIDSILTHWCVAPSHTFHPHMAVAAIQSQLVVRQYFYSIRWTILNEDQPLFFISPFSNTVNSGL